MRLILPMLILLAALLASLAFEQPHPRAELTTGVVSIETIDPQLAHAVDDIRLIYSMFEGLTTFDPATFTVEPGVAHAWQLADDQVTYTFHLRPDARWSDGSPVTADDFSNAWRIGMLPDTAIPYVEFLFFIRGAREFSQWGVTSLKEVASIGDPAARHAAAQKRIAESVERFAATVGVKVVDERTLVVTLEKPVPYFLDIAACWPLFPIPRHVLDRISTIDGSTGMLRRDQQWTKPSNEPRTMIGNGPYRLTAWRFKRELYFEANEFYWNAAQVGPRTVRVANYQTSEAMFNAYASGELDIMFGAQALKFCPDLIAQQVRGERRDVMAVDAFGTYYYAFNCRPVLPDGRPNPMADARVRRALALAVDKRAIVENVTRLRQTVADVFVPRGSVPGYTSPQGLGQDVALAQELLKAAGYPGGAGLPTIEISYNTGAGHEHVAQALGTMWTRNLGVNVSYDAQEWKVFLDRRQSGQFMIARSGWNGDYGDPATYLDLLRTGNGHNNPGYSNPVYDRLMDEAAGERDAARRMELLRQAETIIVRDDLPILPLYVYQLVNLHDPSRVTNVSEHPRQIHMFGRMRVNEPGKAEAN
jgi:oligopeptide transport system substrate-binding protein